MAKTKLQQFNDGMYKLRGALIHEAVFLERMIDFFLSKHFAKNKKASIELTDWVFTERITFENKVQILNLVIQKYFPEFKETHPTYHKDIIYIVEQRNIFAHYLALNDDKDIELFLNDKTISFIKYKNDSTVVYKTKSEYLKLVSLMERYTIAIMILI